jgi:hypothetical protein
VLRQTPGGRSAPRGALLLATRTNLSQCRTGVQIGRRPGVKLQRRLTPKVAQERLGHASITTTLDLYSHVTDSLQEDAAAKLDTAFRSAISGPDRDNH